MNVKTEKATCFEDNDGIVVSHVFRTSEDGRRSTQFYFCTNQKQADVLICALLNNTK